MSVSFCHALQNTYVHNRNILSAILAWNMEEKTQTKMRNSRAFLVSWDWDNVISTGRRISMVKLLVQEKPRAKTKFCTKSTYQGTWNALNMSGYGTYVMPYGAIYEGHMTDGMFDGEGTMTYPMYKQQVKGIWKNGKLITLRYNFANGLAYTDPWSYCKYPDRRFFIEAEELKPAGREYLTAHQPTREINYDGCYDVADGFYNPERRYVHLPLDAKYPGKDVDDDLIFPWITRMVTGKEHKWIVEHCRKAWDEPTGLRRHLYEMWFSGRRREIEEFDKISEDKASTYFFGDTMSDEETIIASTDFDSFM